MPQHSTEIEKEHSHPGRHFVTNKRRPQKSNAVSSTVPAAASAASRSEKTFSPSAVRQRKRFLAPPRPPGPPPPPLAVVAVGYLNENVLLAPFAQLGQLFCLLGLRPRRQKSRPRFAKGARILHFVHMSQSLPSSSHACSFLPLASISVPLSLLPIRAFPPSFDLR